MSEQEYTEFLIAVENDITIFGEPGDDEIDLESLIVDAE